MSQEWRTPSVRNIGPSKLISTCTRSLRTSARASPRAPTLRFAACSLKLPAERAYKPMKMAANGHRSWSDEGVTLTHGTPIRMRYNGRLHEGEIVDGKWIVDGKTFDSPSGAASGVAITKSGKHTRLDGWVYWEAKLPGEDKWTHILSLRTSTVTLEDLGLREACRPRTWSPTPNSLICSKETMATHPELSHYTGLSAFGKHLGGQIRFGRHTTATWPHISHKPR